MSYLNDPLQYLENQRTFVEVTWLLQQEQDSLYTTQEPICLFKH